MWKFAQKAWNICWLLCKEHCFFCSRDCCLCTKHPSVKELRHAGSKGKNEQTEDQTNTTTKHKQKSHKKNKTTATTRLPFAAGETGETGETETTPIKTLVQHCYERQTFFTREDGITLTCREHSRVKGRFRKTTKQTKPQNNTKTKTPPKQTQTNKNHNKTNQSNRTSLSPW